MNYDHATLTDSREDPQSYTSFLTLMSQGGRERARRARRPNANVGERLTFYAHDLNVSQLIHELLALELLTVLLETPTDDSVEVAIEFVKECGFTLQELTPQGLHGIFERFRGILHEGEIDKRVQFMIEGLFAFRKSGFEGKRGVPPELDLVEEDDQLVHEIGLDDEMQAQAGLDVFKQDPEFEENERKYADIRREILGESSESESESESDGSSSRSSSSSSSEGAKAEPANRGPG